VCVHVLLHEVNLWSVLIKKYKRVISISVTSMWVMLQLRSVPRAVYGADGPVHIYGPRPPSETAAAAVSHSPAAVYSSPSTPTSTTVQQHPAPVSSGSVMSPDQATSQISSAGPLVTATQQGAFHAFAVGINGNFCFV